MQVVVWKQMIPVGVWTFAFFLARVLQHRHGGTNLGGDDLSHRHL